MKKSESSNEARMEKDFGKEGIWQRVFPGLRSAENLRLKREKRTWSCFSNRGVFY
jgi:hypothetical protein